MRILAVGDIVGKSGVCKLEERLPDIIKKENIKTKIYYLKSKKKTLKN